MKKPEQCKRCHGYFIPNPPNDDGFCCFMCWEDDIIMEGKPPATENHSHRCQVTHIKFDDIEALATFLTIRGL